MEQALDRSLAWNDLILGGSTFGERIQEPYAAKFGLAKHSTVAEIETLCGSEYVDQYYLFAIVRHPVSRLCSLYNFVASTLSKWAANRGVPLEAVAAHITPQDTRKKPGLKWASSRAFMATGDFSGFIRHEALGSAPGFRPQIDSLVSPVTETRKGTFLRLEELENWLPSLGAELGIELQLPHANQSQVKLIDAASVNSEDKRYIESLFSADFEAFGYEK